MPIVALGGIYTYMGLEPEDGKLVNFFVKCYILLVKGWTYERWGSLTETEIHMLALEMFRGEALQLPDRVRQKYEPHVGGEQLLECFQRMIRNGTTRLRHKFKKQTNPNTTNEAGITGSSFTVSRLNTRSRARYARSQKRRRDIFEISASEEAEEDDDAIQRDEDDSEGSGGKEHKTKNIAGSEGIEPLIVHEKNAQVTQGADGPARSAERGSTRPATSFSSERPTCEYAGNDSKRAQAAGLAHVGSTSRQTTVVSDAQGYPNFFNEAYDRGTPSFRGDFRDDSNDIKLRQPSTSLKMESQVPLGNTYPGNMNEGSPLSRQDIGKLPIRDDANEVQVGQRSTVMNSNVESEHSGAVQPATHKVLFPKAQYYTALRRVNEARLTAANDRGKLVCGNPELWDEFVDILRSISKSLTGLHGSAGPAMSLVHSLQAYLEILLAIQLRLFDAMESGSDPHPNPPGDFGEVLNCTLDALEQLYVALQGYVST